MGAPSPVKLILHTEIVFALDSQKSRSSDPRSLKQKAAMCKHQNPGKSIHIFPDSLLADVSDKMVLRAVIDKCFPLLQ